MLHGTSSTLSHSSGVYGKGALVVAAGVDFVQYPLAGYSGLHPELATYLPHSASTALTLTLPSKRAGGRDFSQIFLY